jgi:hypothetical protein
MARRAEVRKQGHIADAQNRSGNSEHRRNKDSCGDGAVRPSWTLLG